jgi:hypothetical protein
LNEIKNRKNMRREMEKKKERGKMKENLILRKFM